MIVNKLASFPYDVTEDRARFQKSIINGETGYYDAVAKKFISQETLESLLENIIPEQDYHVDSEKETRLSQSLNRIRRNLSVYQRNPSDSYAQIFLKYLSNRYIGSMTEQNIEAAILYVDVVGSTRLATKLSASELSSLIRVFSQEMSIIVSRHGGFVLKYAGDAVIAYFPSDLFGNACENAIRCGNSMNFIIEQSVNFAFQDFALPAIQVRISIDFGNNEIVFLGSEPDLIGHTITITSKMSRFVKPGNIVIGENAYKQLSGLFVSEFVPVSLDANWNYTDPRTGKIYPIYFSGNKR